MCPRALPAFYFGAPVLSWAVLQIQGLVWGGAPRRGSRLSLLLPLGRPRQQCREKLIKTHAGRDPVDQAMRCHRKQAAWCWQSTLWLYNADLFSTQRKIVRSQSSLPQCSTFILANILELLLFLFFLLHQCQLHACRAEKQAYNANLCMSECFSFACAPGHTTSPVWHFFLNLVSDTQQTLPVQRVKAWHTQVSWCHDPGTGNANVGTKKYTPAVKIQRWRVTKITTL